MIVDVSAISFVISVVTVGVIVITYSDGSQFEMGETLYSVDLFK